MHLDPNLGRPDIVRQRASALLAAVGDRLVNQFGLELQIKRFVPWEAPYPTLTAALEGLTTRVDERTDLHFGFLLTSAQSVRVASPRVESRYLGPALVISPIALGGSARSRGARGAADIRALLQGIGTIFGALPACGDTVMSDDTHRKSTPSFQWGPTNARLIRLHSALDLARAREGGLPPDLAQRASKHLGQPGADLRCDRRGHLTRRLRVVAEILAPRIQAAAQAPSRPSTSISDGLAALAARDYRTALARCRPAAESDPTGPATTCAARAAEALGETTLAIRFYRAALANGRKETALRLALARLVGRAGDDAAARALLETCVTDDPGSVKAWLNLGVARARLGDLQGARRAWRTVIELAPDHREAKSLLRQLDAAR